MLFILLVEYSYIDWHDFVVVETINFRENETGQLLYSVILWQQKILMNLMNFIFYLSKFFT